LRELRLGLGALRIIYDIVIDVVLLECSALDDVSYIFGLIHVVVGVIATYLIFAMVMVLCWINVDLLILSPLIILVSIVISILVR
jgi:hypothetical protein